VISIVIFFSSILSRAVSRPSSGANHSGLTGLQNGGSRNSAYPQEYGIIPASKIKG
jgi:hypothetical protein